MEAPDPIKQSDVGPHSPMGPPDPLQVPWSHLLMKPIQPLDPMEPIEPLDAMLPMIYCRSH